MTYLEILQRQLPVDEGMRNKPYRCTAGKLTIGVGRNLDDKGLRNDEIVLLLENDIKDAEKDARSLVARFDGLSEARKAVLVNMAFNLGRDRLSGFRRFLAAVSEGRYDDAADEMLDSQWAVQVKGRANRLADMMRNG